jgi:uncharacterized membrane protein YczE
MFARVSRLFSLPPRTEVIRRLPQLVLGLVLCGVAFGLTVQAELGLDPWDVLHEGIADHIDMSIGNVSVVVGLVVLLAWIPLRERIGIGTVLNTVIIGVTMDLVTAALPEADGAVARWTMLVAGLVIAGPGVGLYIGARLGPGPRDGIMTGIAQRGPSIRLVRTGIEVAALIAGWSLGGTVGIGTVLFAVTIGPNVQFWLDRCDLGHPAGFEPSVDPVVEPDPTLSGA